MTRPREWLLDCSVKPGNDKGERVWPHATGIGLGFIAYVALKALTGRFSQINAAVAVIAVCFLLKLIFA